MNKRLPIVCAALSLVLSVASFTPGATMAAQCDSSPVPGIDWRECSKDNIMLQAVDLEGAVLTGADFSLTDLSGANLASAKLEKANLVRASLADAKAQKADFAKAEAYRASFARIAAEGASFAGAELQRADFTEAMLANSDFEKAELGRANFQKAVLTGARFSLANLSRASLQGATTGGPIDFDRAFMYLTRLEGLDLSAATGLEQAQIDLACGDEATKLPAGLSTPKGWPCASE